MKQKPKEEQNEKNGSKMHAHRGQSVKYRSWWMEARQHPNGNERGSRFMLCSQGSHCHDKTNSKIHPKNTCQNIRPSISNLIFCLLKNWTTLKCDLDNKSLSQRRFVVESHVNKFEIYFPNGSHGPISKIVMVRKIRFVSQRVYDMRFRVINVNYVV